ncbi:hypothetical protein [Actinosynnema sp. NPDC020468]|uniref:hypothetical protein n=1 Tax=Actinosynnema sp. NPDC020468 TaxID=3154488 RepID=UPI0033ED4A7C
MPEPVLVSIAAALSSRAVAGLYDLVRTRFAGDQEATAALAAVEGARPDSPQVRALGQALADAERDDPGFASALRHEYHRTRVDQHGEVNNSVSGTVHGTVVQARDIQGGISFG